MLKDFEDHHTYAYVHTNHDNVILLPETFALFKKIEEEISNVYGDYCYGSNFVISFRDPLSQDQEERLHNLFVSSGYEKRTMQYECNKCGRVYEAGNPCHEQK